MSFSSFDGIEKIYCQTGYPSIAKRIEAYRLAQDKGYTHYGIALFPGSMSCISLGDKSHFGLQPLGKLFDELMAQYTPINNTRKKLDEEQSLLDDFFQQGDW